MNDNRRDSSLPMALEEYMKPLSHITAALAGIGESVSLIDKMVIPDVGVLVEQSKLSIDTYTSLSKVLEERIKPLSHITAAFAGIGKTASLIDKMVPNVGVLIEQSKLSIDTYTSLSKVLEERMKPLAQITAAAAGIGKMSAGVQAMSALGAERPSVLEELRKPLANISAITAEIKSPKIFYDDSYFDVVYGKYKESRELTTYDLFEQTDIDDLEIDFERVLQYTPSLNKRLPIIKQALESHRDRRYLVSIPCLLTQFEGLLVDYLVSENLLTVEGYKVFEKQVDAKNHNRSELNGLKRVAKIIENSGLSKIHFLAVHIKKLLGDERNAILHGRKIDYSSCDFSSWLIRCIYTLACNLYSNETLKHLEKITKSRIVH